MLFGIKRALFSFLGNREALLPDEKIHYLSNHDYQKCAIIDSIFLDPKFRGQGVASRLMKGALARLNLIPLFTPVLPLIIIPHKNFFSAMALKFMNRKNFTMTMTAMFCY